MKSIAQPATLPWRVSVISCGVFGGHCAACGTVLANETLFHDLTQHQSHWAAVSAWVRIITPAEYRGLELKLPAALFLDRDHPYLENFLHLPGIAFQFSCLRCQVQSAVAENEITAFRSSHARHMHLVRLHLVIQKRDGRAVRLAFSLFGQTSGRSMHGLQVPPPWAGTMAQAERLRGLLHTLDCTLSSIQCGVCRSISLPKDQPEMQDEFDRHKHHRTELQVAFTVNNPGGFRGLQLQTRATHLPPQSSWLTPELMLDCLFLELSRKRGGPKVTPWDQSVVNNYFHQHHCQHSPVEFLTIVRGPTHAHVCQFQVTRAHSRDDSQLSEWEQLFLQPAMEEA